uniref:Carbonic anhydrase n=1 Tax=Macrostomum lignano TaxID=282301 RepID=A0A1I8IW69_9PLAT
MDWGYDNEIGPHTWSRRYPDAAGSSQSPINIDTNRAEFSSALEAKPLSFQHPQLSNCSLTNTGASFLVAVDAEVAGGPLPGPYRFAQFHMHWGSSDAFGSEHALNGKFYPAELHLVHWNAKKYDKFEAAASQRDGLAVLGVMIGAPNAELDKVMRQFDNIKTAGARTQLSEPVCLNNLLPQDTSKYFTYPGLSDHSAMLRLESLRSLKSCHGEPPEPLVNNYRHLIRAWQTIAAGLLQWRVTRTNTRVHTASTNIGSK